MDQASGRHTLLQWVTTIGAIIPIAAAAAGSGWWVGTALAKSESAATIAKLQGEIAQLKQQVELAQSHEALAMQANQQWKIAYEDLQSVLAKENKKMSDLASRIGKESNCDFIHQQILSTQQEISASESAGIWSSDKEWQQDQRYKQGILEKRLATYQQQLGGCNR